MSGFYIPVAYGTCPTHHGILTDNLPEGFILPYTISMIASAPIVPGLQAIMTALDFLISSADPMVFLQLPQSRYYLYVLLFFQITPAALPAKSRTPCWQPLLTGIHVSPSTHTTVSSWVIVSSHCSSLGLSDNSCSTCHTLHSSSERILHPVIHSASICFFCKTSSIVSTASCSPKIDQRLNSSLDAV